jgi:hypothetical protein
LLRRFHFIIPVPPRKNCAARNLPLVRKVSPNRR